MTDRIPYGAILSAMIVFAVAMGYFEASIVVYLRELYYPEGFSLPLRIPPEKIILVEFFRELSTIIMLGTVAYVAGRRLWERFGWFILIFGVWDIFYYVWLKVIIDWPATLFDWDILFLIPLPWIGPVIAPCLVAVLMIVFGITITRLGAEGYDFRPTRLSWLFSILATAAILFSFMRDTNATLHQELPQPYRYSLLSFGLILYIAGYIHAHRSSAARGRHYF